MLPAIFLLCLIGWTVATVWNKNPDAGQGWMVACFFIWWVERTFRTMPPPNPVTQSLPAWTVVAGAVMLVGLLAPVRLLLTPFPQQPGLLWIWSLAIGSGLLVGLYLRGGEAWLRRLGVGLLLIAVSLPLPVVVQRGFFDPLREAISWAVAELLNFAGVPSVAFGATIRIGNSWVGMEEACGGLRSFAFAVALAVMVGEAAYLRWSRRLALLALGLLAAVAANFFRVLILCSRIASHKTPSELWHEVSGYLAYVVIIAIVSAVGWKWRSPAPDSNATARPRPASDTSAAVLWLTSLALSFGVLEMVNWLWFHRPSRQWESAWSVAMPKNAPYFQELPLGAAGQKLLQPDFFSGASWAAQDGWARVCYYAEWRHGHAGGSIATAHNPTVCFPAAGCRIAGEFAPLEITWGGLKVPFRCVRFSRGGQDVWAFFTVWDADEVRPFLARERDPSWSGWWRQQWQAVSARRAEFRVQLLTLAIVGDEALGAAQASARIMAKREIERLIIPSRETAN